MKFKSRFKEVDAFQFLGNDFYHCQRFLIKAAGHCEQCHFPYDRHGLLANVAFESGELVCIGDWIITLKDGKQFRCPPGLFQCIYEPKK